MAAEADVLFEAGTTLSTSKSLSFDFRRSSIPSDKRVAMARFVEFWCQSHCVGAWHITQTRRAISVGFERDRDAVHFALSEIFDQLAKRLLVETR